MSNLSVTFASILILLATPGSAYPPNSFNFPVPTSTCPFGYPEALVNLFNLQRNAELNPPLTLSAAISTQADGYAHYLSITKDSQLLYYRQYAAISAAVWWSARIPDGGYIRDYETATIFKMLLNNWSKKHGSRDAKLWSQATMVGFGCLVAGYPPTDKDKMGGTNMILTALLEVKGTMTTTTTTTKPTTPVPVPFTCPICPTCPTPRLVTCPPAPTCPTCPPCTTPRSIPVTCPTPRQVITCPPPVTCPTTPPATCPTPPPVTCPTTPPVTCPTPPPVTCPTPPPVTCLTMPPVTCPTTPPITCPTTPPVTCPICPSSSTTARIPPIQRNS